MIEPARPGFNHNDYYHRFLLRNVPSGCGQALDVGCGTGVFARRLARHAHVVAAIDQDREVIATARANSPGLPNINYIETDLTNHDLGRYDFISCVASIHHMPFAETITLLRDALTPGGVLAIVGCYRQASVADYLPDLVAVPANLVANRIVRHQVNAAPVRDPEMTLPEITREARRLLPGAVIRRRLFWRYSLVFQQELA